MRAAVLVLTLILAGCVGESRRTIHGDLADELQRTRDKERAFWNIPGAVAAVIVEGEGDWVGTSGKADLETAEPMTPETLLGIGRVTKSFVAALVLDLVEDNVLSLDARPARWLPAYARADRITLRQLLNHTSGVPNVTESSGFMRAQLGEREPD